MKTVKFLALMTFAAFFLASCGSSMKITTDFDRGVDFSKYKTFGIYNLAADAQTVSELNKNRIYSAIKASMREKGLTESSTPDIWINSLAVVDLRESHSSTTTTTGMGMGMGMGGFHRPYMWGGGAMMMGGPMMMGGSSVAHTRHNVDIYKKGSLMIDIIDAQSNSLVWHATGDKEINKNFGRDADQKITKYVGKLLESFPPETIVHMTTVVKDKK